MYFLSSGVKGLRLNLAWQSQITTRLYSDHLQMEDMIFFFQFLVLIYTIDTYL